MAEVTIDGEVFGSWPLSEDRTVEIGDGNRLVIEDGKADMVWADCPDKLCVNQKAISREGESIICLPNKVVVSIVGGEEREVDAVTWPGQNRIRRSERRRNPFEKQSGIFWCIYGIGPYFQLSGKPDPNPVRDSRDQAGTCQSADRDPSI